MTEGVQTAGEGSPAPLPIDDIPEAAPPAIAAQPPSMLMLGQLVPSPLNPRRQFDPAKLAELAESIRRQGLLQPLVVRPMPAAARRMIVVADAPVEPVEIVAGERRWRAMMALAQDGAATGWAPDVLVPCVVRNCSDVELVETAATENLAREDMHPLDEAAVFDAMRKALVAEGWGKGEKGGRPEAEIARRLGVGERTVFRRLSLLRLEEPAREALRDGRINRGQAAALALAPAEQQGELVKRIEEHVANGWEPVTPDDIVHQIDKAPTIHSQHALFDLALYSGDQIPDPDSEVHFYFGDIEQFRALQRAAIDAKKAELVASGEHAFVEEVGENGWWKHYEHGHGGAKKAGALLLVSEDLCRVEVRTGMVPRVDRPAPADTASAGAAGKPAAEKPRPPLTRGQLVAVKHAQTRALRRAVAASPRVAIAVACVGLLAHDHDGIRLSTSFGMPGSDDHVTAAPADAARVAATLAPIADLDVAGHRVVSDKAQKNQAALLDRLLALDDAALVKIFAELIGESIGVWPGHNPAPGVSPLVAALAAATGADAHLAEAWAPDEAYWKAFDRPTLIARGTAAGVMLGDWADAKKGALVTRCQNADAGTWTLDRFPELRWEDEKTVTKALKAPPTPRPPTKVEKAAAAAAKTLQAAEDAGLVKGRAKAAKPAPLPDQLATAAGSAKAAAKAVKAGQRAKKAAAKKGAAS